MLKSQNLPVVVIYTEMHTVVDSCWTAVANDCLGRAYVDSLVEPAGHVVVMVASGLPCDFAAAVEAEVAVTVGAVNTLVAVAAAGTAAAALLPYPE